MLETFQGNRALEIADMKTFEVTVIPRNPAYGDRGSVLTIYAKTKAKAISEARKETFRQCLYDRLDWPLVYKAVEV